MINGLEPLNSGRLTENRPVVKIGIVEKERREKKRDRERERKREGRKSGAERKK